MTKPFLGDRRASFEELFFAKQDAKVIAALRQAHERKAAIEGLARASNIEDPELLERLVDLGIDARSWTALSLVPLVEVAWADGTIDEKERTAILAAALALGGYASAAEVTTNGTGGGPWSDPATKVAP